MGDGGGQAERTAFAQRQTPPQGLCQCPSPPVTTRSTVMASSSVFAHSVSTYRDAFVSQAQVPVPHHSLSSAAPVKTLLIPLCVLLPLGLK